jgi:hypothetical protein
VVDHHNRFQLWIRCIDCAAFQCRTGFTIQCNGLGCASKTILETYGHLCGDQPSAFLLVIPLD